MSTELNPYQAPQEIVPAPGNALYALRIPSIAILFLGAVTCLYISLWLVILLQIFMETATAIDDWRFWLLVAAVLLWLSTTLFVMWGSICMLRGKRYGVAIYSAMIACVPIASPCIVLGIPFGIWALIVLCRSKVEDAFRS